MTRLAVQHQAINLAQGFTDEPPDYELVWGAITALLGGEDPTIERLEHLTLRDLLAADKQTSLDFLFKTRIRDLLKQIQGPRDQFNQYSFPFGLPELRNAISEYTEHFCSFRPDPEKEITVVLGSTEGLSSSLRATCQPGDSIILFQPFHEMYPSQAHIFGLHPKYLTLKENQSQGTWELDRKEFERIASENIRALILNSPHNPTGKVFSREDLLFIADCCQKYNLLVITDEIYEHILLGERPHISMASLEGMRERTIVLNSISKTGNATGWRVGWVISPPAYTSAIRSIHDNLVIQSPTPLQKAAVRLLSREPSAYQSIRSKYLEKCSLLIKTIRSVGFEICSPEGAYYLFAQYRKVPSLANLAPMDATLFMIQKLGVAVVPGDTFYRQGNQGNLYLRFAFCRSYDSLREAARRLEKLKS